MSTDKPSDNESIEQKAMTTDNDLAGVSVDGASMQVQNLEDPARVVVDMIAAESDDLVGLSIRSDSISGRVFLDAEAADEVAARLATVAEEAATDN